MTVIFVREDSFIERFDRGCYCWKFKYACGEKGDVAKHIPVMKVIPATFTKAGLLVTQCSVCKKVIKTENFPTIKIVELSRSIYVYDGKVKNPALTVNDSTGKCIVSKYYKGKKASGRKNV